MGSIAVYQTIILFDLIKPEALLRYNISLSCIYNSGDACNTYLSQTVQKGVGAVNPSKGCTMYIAKNKYNIIIMILLDCNFVYSSICNHLPTNLTLSKSCHLNHLVLEKYMLSWMFYLKITLSNTSLIF